MGNIIRHNSGSAKEHANVLIPVVLAPNMFSRITVAKHIGTSEPVAA